MTNVNELKDALKETLEERGVLNQIRALMRQSIFEAIESDDKPKPKLTDENLIINELIREYLIYNNYLHTNSVFLSESGQPKEAFDRNFLAKELNILEDPSSKKLPLLYSVLFGLKKESSNVNMSNYNYSINPNMNSNVNPMTMVESSKIYTQNNINPISGNNNGNSVNEINTNINQQDQPKPWVIG